MHSGVGFVRTFLVASRRMQLLSLGQLLGTVGVQQVSAPFQELMQRPEVQRYFNYLVGLLIIGQVLRILALWASSRVVVKRDTARFDSAVKVWLGHLVLLVLFCVAVGILAPIVSTLQQTWRALLAYGGLALLTAVLVFLIPMKIYFIGFWRAFGTLLLAVVMETVVLGGLSAAAQVLFMSEKDRVALRQLGEANAEEWQSRVDEMRGINPSAHIDSLLDGALHNQRRPLSEREAAVRTLQKKLDRRRRTLPPGDRAAAAKFRQQFDRYMLLLREVQTERAASSIKQA